MNDPSCWNISRIAWNDPPQLNSLISDGATTKSVQNIPTNQNKVPESANQMTAAGSIASSNSSHNGVPPPPPSLMPPAVPPPTMLSVDNNQKIDQTKNIPSQNHRDLSANVCITSSLLLSSSTTSTTVSSSSAAPTENGPTQSQKLGEFYAGIDLADMLACQKLIHEFYQQEFVAKWHRMMQPQNTTDWNFVEKKLALAFTQMKDNKMSQELVCCIGLYFKYLQLRKFDETAKILSQLALFPFNLELSITVTALKKLLQLWQSAQV